MLAPIVIFAFNRPEALEHMLTSLKNNPEYTQSDKYFFIDGPRTENERKIVDRVEFIARKESSNVIRNQKNLGLGSNIIKGVSQILTNYDSAIILEDDLILQPGFLQYMNEGLEYFKNDKNILAVCGYSLKIKVPQNYKSSVYLADRASSWGWATWKDRWKEIDWNVSDWNKFSQDKKSVKAFKHAGSDMYSMLYDFMEGRNHSWAIRFCYHQFRHNMHSVHPTKSLVDNEGFGETATNCRQKYSRFKIDITSHNPILIDKPLEPNDAIISQLHRYHSIYMRIYSRIRKFLNI